MANRIFPYIKTTAPTANDDTGDGYKVGDEWHDTTADIIYKVIDVTLGAAIWIEIVGRTQTQTLTNKRIAPRVGTVASSATPTINTDNVDVFTITALTTNITSMTSGLSGTPTDSQTLLISIVGTATRTIAWGASFEDGDIVLPTATVGTDRLDVFLIYNPATSKWRCKGSAVVATSARAGYVELSTDAEAITGTDTARALTPANARAILATVPDGTVFNLKLSVTVVSNDLVVAWKTHAGTDPSATDPGYVKINGTVRSVTAATSCTIPDGTSYFASGSATLGTHVVGYFAYAIWDSNSSIVAISIARIPYGRLVSDFSATTTNEKHLFNFANFTSTDDVSNVGYLEATLSLAGTSHVWTVPTFTNKNLKNYPVFVTNQLTFTPVFTNLSVGDGTLSASYSVRHREMVLHHISLVWGSTTSISGAVTFTMPFTDFVGGGFNPKSSMVAYLDAGTAYYLGTLSVGAINQLVAYGVGATYATIVSLSSTVPFTWVATDQINIGSTDFLIG